MTEYENALMLARQYYIANRKYTVAMKERCDAMENLQHIDKTLADKALIEVSREMMEVCNG